MSQYEYYCKLCGKTFNKPNKAINHIIKQHNISQQLSFIALGRANKILQSPNLPEKLRETLKSIKAPLRIKITPINTMYSSGEHYKIEITYQTPLTLIQFYKTITILDKIIPNISLEDIKHTQTTITYTFKN